MPGVQPLPRRVSPPPIPLPLPRPPPSRPRHLRTCIAASPKVSPCSSCCGLPPSPAMAPAMLPLSFPVIGALLPRRAFPFLWVVRVRWSQYSDISVSVLFGFGGVMVSMVLLFCGRHILMVLYVLHLLYLWLAFVFSIFVFWVILYMHIIRSIIGWVVFILLAEQPSRNPPSCPSCFFPTAD